MIHYTFAMIKKWKFIMKIRLNLYTFVTSFSTVSAKKSIHIFAFINFCCCYCSYLNYFVGYFWFSWKKQQRDRQKYNEHTSKISYAECIRILSKFCFHLWNSYIVIKKHECSLKWFANTCLSAYVSSMRCFVLSCKHLVQA